MQRVLFHSINGLGLGHLRRSVLVYDKLKQLLGDGLHSIFVTSAEQHYWLHDRKVPFYFFPSEARDKYTRKIDNSCIPPEKIASAPPDGMNSRLLDQMVQSGALSCVICDTYYPANLPETCRSMKIPFFGIFDSDWCSALHSERVKQTLNSGGHILVANVPSQNNYSDQFKYCGMVLPDRDKQLETLISLKYWSHQRIPRIVCAQGGGGFNANNSTFYRTHLSFLDIILSALSDVAKSEAIDAHIFCGPFSSLPDRILPEGIHLHQFEPELPSLLASTDLAILKAGYNATTESISASCPSIFIPSIEETDDQHQNLHALKDGFHHEVLNKYNAKELTNKILDLLKDKERLKTMRMSLATIPDLIKGRGVAQCIADHLTERTAT
jgi:predicted glycosyltransferase